MCPAGRGEPAESSPGSRGPPPDSRDSPAKTHPAGSMPRGPRMPTLEGTFVQVKSLCSGQGDPTHRPSPTRPGSTSPNQSYSNKLNTRVSLDLTDSAMTCLGPSRTLAAGRAEFTSADSLPYRQKVSASHDGLVCNLNCRVGVMTGQCRGPRAVAGPKWRILERSSRCQLSDANGSDRHGGGPEIHALIAVQLLTGAVIEIHALVAVQLSTTASLKFMQISQGARGPR